MNARVELAGLQPKRYMLDNECSKDLRLAFTKHNIAFQLERPHLHRANAAERAIQTFKAHLKAGLASLDPDFPVKEWDRLIVQAEITLNLLRSSRINPKLSAYAYSFGQFNYNKTPMVPPGTKVVAHLKPDVRSTWSANGEEGWTVGPSMHHYRCIKCYFPITRSERNVDTVTFFPKQIPFPKVTIDDFLRQAATDIVSILAAPPSATSFSLQAGDPIRNALLEIANTLNRADKLPLLPLPHGDHNPPRVDNNRWNTSYQNYWINLLHLIITRYKPGANDIDHLRPMIITLGQDQDHLQCSLYLLQVQILNI